MKTQYLGLTAMALFVGVPLMAAAPDCVVGVVNSHTPAMLQITSHGDTVATVQLDEHTAYLAWITHKPWQQSRGADAHALLVGRCVAVALSERHTAKTIFISDEAAGSIFDPCKDRR